MASSSQEVQDRRVLDERGRAGGEVRVGEGSKDGSWEILAADPCEVQLGVLCHGENVWVVSKHLPVPLEFQ